MEGLKLVSSQFRNSNVWHTGLPAAGPIRPSLPWCFSPAGGPFLTGAVQGESQLQESWQCRRAGKVKVSTHFRRSRLALWAAGRGPDPPELCRPKASCKRTRAAPRWAHIALKIGQHSPKMGQHSPKIGRRSSNYPSFYNVFFAVPIFRLFRLNMGQHEANIGLKIGQT